jgi:hypothetical protein
LRETAMRQTGTASGLTASIERWLRWHHSRVALPGHGSGDGGVRPWQVKTGVPGHLTGDAAQESPVAGPAGATEVATSEAGVHPLQPVSTDYKARGCPSYSRRSHPGLGVGWGRPGHPDYGPLGEHVDPQSEKC